VSAIFGILRFDGSTASAHDLQRMSDALARRGPDGRRFVVAGPVGLGHCLMRVNQEDLLEQQPLHDREADLALVADCRIDNREELAGVFGIGAAALRGIPDSALILRAYKKWGEDCAQHLIGDFAFAIWDGRAKKLVLARDHMGQRSVLYHHGKGLFAFATEVGALWRVPGVPRELSDAGLGHYFLLAHSTTKKTTLFEGISFVGGGSIEIINSEGNVAERRYWEPHPDPAWLGRTENDYVARYREVLAEAVECRIRRLICPPALFLSGGFDSGAIAALAGPVLAKQGRKLIGVSCVMPEDYAGPEPCARRWIELCRSTMPHLDVHYFVRTNESGFDNLEQKYADGSGIPDLAHHVTDALLDRASAAGARLVMDGLVGDATLNPRGGGVLRDFLRARRLGLFVTEAVAHLRTRTRSLKQILLGDMIVGQAPRWLRLTWSVIRRRARPMWMDWPIAPDFATQVIETGIVDPTDIRVGQIAHLSRAARMKKTQLTVMTKPNMQIVNEAAGRCLELTRPMLDKRVVEFGQAIPLELWVKNGRDRHLARRALSDVYPAEFQTRSSEQSAYNPGYFDALSGELPKLRARIDRLAGNVSLKKYFDFEEMDKALADIGRSRPRNKRTWQALRGFYAATYIAWFRRENI